jgi:hypothetical protein
MIGRFQTSSNKVDEFGIDYRFNHQQDREKMLLLMLLQFDSAN